MFAGGICVSRHICVYNKKEIKRRWLNKWEIKQKGTVQIAESVIWVRNGTQRNLGQRLSHRTAVLLVGGGALGGGA